MKLPHWANVALSFFVIALTWVLAEQAKGAFAIPAQYVAALTTVLKLVDTVIGLTTDSVQTSLAMKRALRASVAKMSAVLALAMFALGCGAVPPQLVGPSVDLGVCVLGSVGKCLAAGTPFTVCIDQAAASCIESAPTADDKQAVTKMWAAHVAAEVVEHGPSDAGSE